MGQIQIYFDEDAMDNDLAAALRSRGVTVITATDAGLIGRFNVSDFYRLHTQWVNAGREHCGMILAPQQRFSVGEQFHRILRLRATLANESIRNRVEFLANWG